MVTQWKHLSFGVAACSLLAGILPLQADNQRSYPESGKVISVASAHGYVYTVETSGKVYQLLCTSVSFFQIPRPCKIDGKPLAANDKINFREKADYAYVQSTGNSEVKLGILSAELKILPPLPTVRNGDSGAVLGLGMEVAGSRSRGIFAPNIGASTSTAGGSVMPTGPVEAIPVTGGPPVEVIPSGPVSGGVVTGTPTTGGPPVTAVPVAPVSGTPIGNTPAPTIGAPVSGGPSWVHFVRVQTSNRVYDLACRFNSCSLDRKQIQLGDLVGIRITKKYAYLSPLTAGKANEGKFEILAVHNIGDKPTAPPH